MNAILFGFKGAGKTHFGRLLAKETGKNFIDTDEEIIKIFGIGTIREIQQAMGDENFRSLESQVILSLTGVQNTIISLGGGAVLSSENVEILKKIGQMIYLDASFTTLEKRIVPTGTPSFALTTTLRSVYLDRLPIYQAIPARRIDTDLLDEPGVLAELKTILYLEDKTDGL